MASNHRAVEDSKINSSETAFSWQPPSLSQSECKYRSWEKKISLGKTLEYLTANHQRYTDTWRASEGFSSSRTLLENTVLKQETVTITQVVCLCLGSLSSFHMYMDHLGNKTYDHAMSQLVALEGWIEILR